MENTCLVFPAPFVEARDSNGKVLDMGFRDYLRPWVSEGL